MMRLLPLILLLTACASPSPGYLGGQRHDVQVDEVRFAVYPRATEAQVIRLSYLRRADRPGMTARMMQAAERATGCTAVADSLKPQGGPNSAVALVDLRCGD